ncbi:hypothetical protein KA107_02645 [Candidatus Pacearchaeota archaeon]|nr:hypothetical protein [Candidatus Pacearchaeota archaeon]
MTDENRIILPQKNGLVDFCGEPLNDGDYQGLKDLFGEVFQFPENEYIGCGNIGPIGIRDSRVVKVRIYNAQLKRLPETVRYFTQIQEMNLGYNYLRTVVNQLGDLRNLRELGLTHNLIPSAEIQELTRRLPHTRIWADEQVV